MQRGKKSCKNKKIISVKKLISFLVMVTPHRSPSSKVSFVPCDHIVQRAHSCRRSCTLSIVSYFATSTSCVPATKKSPKTQNNSRHTSSRTQRSILITQSINQSINRTRVYMYLYKYPVCVISVAVNVAVV